jgi:predicted AAA+ superfamily ATPase
MTDERILEALHRWNSWGNSFFQEGISREMAAAVEPWLERPEILVILGMRRTGKSTLLRQIAGRLRRRGIPDRDVLFLNFEDPLFLELPPVPASLDRILSVYRAVLRPAGRPWLLLDEVQAVEGWGRWVRAQQETGQARVAVTGSSSGLLEPEAATVLTGRTVQFRLDPLSFKEFLSFRGREATELEQHGLASGLSPLLAEYLQYGGLPEPVLAPSDNLRETLLRRYFQDILFRDVVARHGVRDLRGLEQVAHHLLVHTGALVTWNRIKDQYGLNLDPVRSYAAALEGCHLLRTMPRFSFRVPEQARAPRKVYASDTGLRNAVSFRFSADLGRLAETAVFNHVARDPDLRLYYHADHGECDFVAWRGATPIRAVQVCFGDAGAEIPAREVEGLHGALVRFGLDEGLVVTRDALFERKLEGRTIRGVPLASFLLEG